VSAQPRYIAPNEGARARFLAVWTAAPQEFRRQFLAYVGLRQIDEHYLGHLTEEGVRRLEIKYDCWCVFYEVSRGRPDGA
jgi:hypothetical protein